MRINFSGFIFTFFLWFSQFIGSPRLKRGTEKRKKLREKLPTHTPIQIYLLMAVEL